MKIPGVIRNRQYQLVDVSEAIQESVFLAEIQCWASSGSNDVAPSLVCDRIQSSLAVNTPVSSTEPMIAPTGIAFFPSHIANKDSADTLRMLLRLKGNEIRTANDGLEAVRVTETFHPQVVLLDIGLRKLNGYDVARLICQQP